MHLVWWFVILNLPLPSDVTCDGEEFKENKDQQLSPQSQHTNIIRTFVHDGKVQES